jgi:hypothetical protein
MFASVLTATINLLTFRAGPQDFPYSQTLTPWTMAFAVAANLSVFAQIIPLPLALVMALTMVFGLALVARVLLRARQLEPRYNQTLNSLLVTGGVLTLALAPLFASVAPLLRELASNPELMNQAEKMKFPQGTMFLMNLLNFWNFAVSASIFRQAANVNILFGLLIALIAALSVMFFVIVFTSLIGGILGLNAS